MDARSWKWQTASPSETLALGRAIGGVMPGGTTLGLVGPLGAGKTLLVKGIAIGNQIDDPDRVTSPTFTLVNEYLGRLRLFHLDTYRLPCPRDFLALGFEEMIRNDSVLLIEWADRVRSLLPEDTVWITVRPLDANQREIIAGISPVVPSASTTWLSALSIDTFMSNT